MTEYTSPCPYFVALTEPDAEGKRKLLCKTRAKPYTGALYDSGCSPESKPGYDGCRLYWLKRIQDDLEAPAPREIEQGSVKNMQTYYEEKAKCQTTPPAACACQSCEKPDCICAGGLNFYGRESCNEHNNCAQSGCSYAVRHRPASNEPPEIVDEASEPDCQPQKNQPLPVAQNTDLPAFDYTEVDESTGRRLAELQDEAYRARSTYIITMARIVGEAHDLLASYHGGMFMAWCKRIGLSLGTTQNFLTVSQLLRNSTDEELKVLETQPATLLYSAARKDAPAELVQAVKDGDITSNKQYQEALKELDAERAARREAEKRTKGLEDSYRTAHANEEYAIKRAEEARKAAEEAKAAQSALLDQQGEYIAKIRELESRPVDVAVAEPDPAEVDKLAQKKAEALTAELRGKLKTAENNIQQMHARTASLQGQLEDWREAAQRQTPLTMANVLPLAKDLAASVTALYNTFTLAACELRGDEYTQCAAPLSDALQDALTGLRATTNERNAVTYKEDEDFE